MVYVQPAKGKTRQAATTSGSAFLLAEEGFWPPDIAAVLGKVGLEARTCEDVNEAFDYSYEDTPSLIVVAMSNPVSVVRQLRGLRPFQEVGIFAIVSHEPDIISALEAGADDAAHLGASHEIIASRLRALMRRQSRREKRNGVLRVRELRIDMDKYQVSFRGRVVPATPTEFRILTCLAQRAGRVVDAVTLLRAASGHVTDEKDAQNVIKVHIANIRRKLHDAESYILSVRGFGYLLERRSTIRENDPLVALLEPALSD
ncbi:MAG TPA: response regulator transcription factor [Dehalococcoidia bacterium]|nr:response regulator transcription factor [Dehalococcoidia bacterium]